MQNLNLEQARQAASQLQALQTAASQLPTLEKEEGRKQSLAQIEQLRVKVSQDNVKLYQNYQTVYEAYIQKFNAVITAMRDCASELKRLFALRRQIENSSQRYAGATIEHKMRFENLSPYQSSYDFMLAQNEIIPGKLELPLTPVQNNSTLNDLLRLLQTFI